MPAGPTLVVATLVVTTAELTAVDEAVVATAALLAREAVATLADALIVAGAAPPQALSSAALPVNVAAASKNCRRDDRAPNPAIAWFPFQRGRPNPPRQITHRKAPGDCSADGRLHS